jgi:hypothetical protein
MPVFFLYDHALLFVVDRGSIRFILSLSPLRIALFFISSVPKFIQGYNGKPALVTKSGTFTRRDNYIEFTINVNMWAFLAKKGLFALIPTFPEFVFNVGFTIEARNDEEMPGERAFIVGGGGTHLCCLPNIHHLFSSSCGLHSCYLYRDRGAPGGMQTHEFGSG